MFRVCGGVGDGHGPTLPWLYVPRGEQESQVNNKVVMWWQRQWQQIRNTLGTGLAFWGPRLGVPVGPGALHSRARFRARAAAETRQLRKGDLLYRSSSNSLQRLLHLQGWAL